MNENDIDLDVIDRVHLLQECVKQKHSLPEQLDWLFDRDTITKHYNLIDKIEIRNFLKDYKTEEEQFKQLKIIITECNDEGITISIDWWIIDDKQPISFRKFELANRIASFAVLIAICRKFKSYDEYLATYLANELTEPEDIWINL